MQIKKINIHNIKAKKHLGQNFLINDNILNQIASFFHVNQKNIIEIGPGYGTLTEKLVFYKPKAMHLVEIDREMISLLKKRIQNNEFYISDIDFQIFHKDILQFQPKFHTYFVIANIPYYISSPILYHFIYKVKNNPESMLLLVQKDVGERILGGKKQKSSVLSLFVQKKYKVKKIFCIQKESFFPIPKVESMLLCFERYHLFDDINDSKFLKIIKIGFQEKRKKLLKNFICLGYEKKYIMEIFSKISLDENIRGEDINISKWCILVNEIKQ